jgi:hypothetical protein
VNGFFIQAIPGVFCCLSGLNTVHGQARTAKATAKATGQRTVLPRGSADLFRPPQSHKISISFKIYQDDHQDDQWILNLQRYKIVSSAVFCPFLVGFFFGPVATAPGHRSLR